MVLMKKPSMSESPSGRAPERSPDGISRKQKLAAAKKYFRASLWRFQDFWEFIGERGRAEEAKGAHEPARRPPGARLGGSWPPPWPSPWFSGLLDPFCYGKNHSAGFIPFGLRLIFSSENGQNTEKTETGTWH